MTHLRTKIAAFALAGVATFGIGVGLSQRADAQPSQSRTERAEARQERLQQLIDEGIMSQERADEIRDRIAERRARFEKRQVERMEHLDEIAASLGTTGDELKADLKAGASLAEIAKAAGVDVETLIDDIEEHITARVEEAVADGTIDQERADERLAELRDRITARVDGERPIRPERPGGIGPFGRGHHRPGR